MQEKGTRKRGKEGKGRMEGKYGGEKKQFKME